LKGGVNSFDGELKTIETMDVSEFENVVTEVNVVDVRKPGEYKAEHVDGAKHYALDYINENLNELEKGTKYHVHCAGGYRSVIAISILMQKGYDKLINITEGYRHFGDTKIPLTNFVCASEGK
jgi:rhodanese-related sulfurtransferase